ncbi:MAG TPA: hypothetical protein VGC86_18105 [Afipia sp.]
MSKSNTRRSSGQIWRWPALLAILTVFGLISALLGQGGLWWALSWIALAIPLAVIAACVYRRKKP